MEPTNAEILCDMEKTPSAVATCLAWGHLTVVGLWALIPQRASHERNCCDPEAVGSTVLYHRSPFESQDGERIGRQHVSKEKASKFCKSLVFSWNVDKIDFCKF